MKSRFLVQVFCLALFVYGCSSHRPQSSPCSLREDDIRWFQSALDGWHQVSKDFLLLDPKPIPWVVLFDDACTWHFAATAEIPGSEPAKIRLTYAGEPVPARVIRHNGKVHLPNETEIPAEIMAAAFPTKGQETAFFALATLDLWRRHPPAAKDPQLEKRLLSVVLHEIMHTRQLPYMALRFADMEKRFELPAQVNDDIVENRFKDVPGFSEAFKAERDLLYSAVAEADPVRLRTLIDQALGMALQRRDRFFTGADQAYAELEELFLNMEGAAEWARFKYHQAAPGNTMSDAEIISFIRGGANSWSQDEGLALVLLLEKEVPGWQRQFLGPEMASPLKCWRATPVIGRAESYNDPMGDREKKARAAARRSWPIRVYRLGEEPDDDLSATTTAAQRLAMMWPLAVDAWASSGQPIPDYPRHEMPARILRASDRGAKGEPG